MKKYNKILVFENDSEFQGLPYTLKLIQKAESIKFDAWYDFSVSFQRNQEDAFKRLSEIDTNTLCLSAPSFVGPGNSFGGYLGLFLELKELGIKLDLAITYYPDGFFTYLLKFLYDEQNYMKKQNNHRMLQEVLDFHNIYEIDMDNINLNDGNISNSHELITWENLMKYYFETHRKLERSKVRVRNTGEIYETHYVYVNKNIDELEITLMIPDDYNNKYKLTELERC